MATTQNIVDRSLRLLGVLESGVSAGTNESNDALTALNAMTDSWRNDSLMVYAYRDESLAMALNKGTIAVPYTIGTAGDLNTTRPVSIEDAYIVQNNNSYWVRILSDEEYDSLPSKSVTSNWPESINYRPTMPTGTLYTYPVSDGTTATLHLRTRVPVSSLLISDTIALPPGWEDALASNLAIRMAGEYQIQPSPLVMKMAQESLASIKRINSQPKRAHTELPWLVGATHRANILTDQP